MASTELDPLFLKGLKLLHSRSKDSAEQLKQLFEEALLQSKQAASAPKDKSYSSIKIESESKLHLKKSVSRDDSPGFKVQEDGRKREAEKRHQDKISGHVEDVEIIHDLKIPKLESAQGISYYPPSPDLPKLDHFVSRRVEEDSDSSEENADADDFAMEMGLACVICKQLDVTQGNQLIECQECHSLYHQECHIPPASDYDVNDPRRVWYCAKCTKNMKKMASKTQKTTKSSSITTTTTTQARFSKTETSQPSLVLPFKRTELKAPVSQGNNQSSANKPIGLAGLAANFSGRVTTAASSISSSSSSRPSGSKAASTTQLKSFNSLPLSSSSSSISSSKTSSNSSSASVKLVSSSSHSSSSVSVPPLVISKNASSSSSSSVKSGLGLLSTVSAAAAAARAAPPVSSSSSSSASSSSSSSSSNNGGTKPATCSLLMSADKRVQIMKKRAAKMQEKRRMPK